MGTLIGWLMLKTGVGEKGARAIAYAGLALLIVAALGMGKCAYDRSVIAHHEQKAELEQAKRERTADTNLGIQKGRDEAAAQQRSREIDDATRNIPDQAPSARQRARACLELRRQAEKRGKPQPAC